MPPFGWIVLAALQAPEPPPSMRNELRVRVVEHVDDENDPAHTRQRGPFLFEGPGTLFEFDHERHFQEPSRLDVPPSKIPLDVRIVGAWLDFDVDAALGGLSLVGNPLNPPQVTGAKPRGGSRLWSASDADPSDGAATSPIVGPEFVYPLSTDLSRWSGLSWLPRDSRLSMFGRAGFGTVEVYGAESEVILLSAGPQLLFPLSSSRSFLLGASLSFGPAWLETGIGSALGFEGMAGLRGEVPLASGVAFVALAEASWYASENVRAWGPGLSLGLTFSW
jgi:hypothetical protein